MARLALWIHDGCGDFELTKDMVHLECFREACNGAVSEARRLNRTQSCMPSDDVPPLKEDGSPVVVAEKLNLSLQRQVYHTLEPEDQLHPFVSRADVTAVVDKSMRVAEEMLRHNGLKKNPVYAG